MWVLIRPFFLWTYIYVFIFIYIFIYLYIYIYIYTYVIMHIWIYSFKIYHLLHLYYKQLIWCHKFCYLHLYITNLYHDVSSHWHKHCRCRQRFCATHLFRFCLTHLSQFDLRIESFSSVTWFFNLFTAFKSQLSCARGSSASVRLSWQKMRNHRIF